MKKFAFLFAAVFSGLMMVSCGSTKVSRVDSDEVIDLDGYWNESDVRIVCDSLIEECISSPRIAKFEGQQGHAPVVIIDSIRNQSSEHIDTSIVEKKFQTAIINSGVMEFVSSSTERQALREEKADQADHSTYDTAKEMDQETGADFMLKGSVKTIVQSAGDKTVRTYYVYAELHDIKTNKIVWMAENDSIKKVIKRQKAKL
ncbi:MULTISPECIES: penicillin-binding protein activator LpoB [unclassified Treponema]|uniref:penicillin-binding protein activator LpoB n=1 Tax=unclassified Treponema TaxID=2638727 RepID=UPI000E953423|nr:MULTISPECIES: penicillin-binding protein activator LpoB [unclassified Treponema]HBP09236.1 penicillin-binding protein activator LpoB [Treponema sp.]